MTKNEQRWLLKLEAVNFSSVLFDVDDLSAIRGGGEAMLAAPGWALARLGEALPASAEVEPLFSAASSAVARVTGVDRAAIGEALEPILNAVDADAALEALATAGAASELCAHLIPHLVSQLTFAWGCVPEDRGLDALEREVRFSQYRRLSVDVPPLVKGNADCVDRPCPHDRVRPRLVRGIMPDGTERDLSLSIALRRSLGRSGRRRQFYERVLADADEGQQTAPDCGFAHEFAELVEAPPAGVPKQWAGKIALLSLDVNGLGALRGSLSSTPDAAVAFSDRLKTLRANFLHDLLAWATAQDFMRLEYPKRKEIDGAKRKLPVLRFEMLAWGADELAFVFPAWALEPMLRELAILLETNRWKIDGASAPVTHGAGLVAANHKAPIGLIKQFADELCNSAKQVSRRANLLQYWISGSIDMPTRADLGHEREVLFAVPRSDIQAQAFTLPIDHAAAGFDLLRRVKGQSGNREIGIPRQQLSQLAPAALRELLEKRNYVDEFGNRILADDIFGNDFFKPVAAHGQEKMIARHMLELWQGNGLNLESPAA